MPEAPKPVLKADIMLIAGQLDVTTEYLQRVAPDVKAPEMVLSAILGVVTASIMEADRNNDIEPLRTLMRHCAEYARVRVAPDGRKISDIANDFIENNKKDQAFRNN